MEKKRPLILVSNDDGITAPGIKALVEVVMEFGEVVVVAPDSPQSGMGHAITITEPLRLDQSNYFGPEVQAYQCSGTPADCVKLAIDKVLHRKPDLLVSGINHGSNSSINVIYSGTMSAAVEGAIDGIQAVGFSLLDYALNADFDGAKSIVRRVVSGVLKHGMPADTLLNVNIPMGPVESLNGIKICRQARAKWVEEFDERTDPYNRRYYWLTGKFKDLDHGEDTDEWALKHNYASVVPVQFDLTAHHAMGILNTWDLNE
ncbi:MAG: 5'/3'-nucleotidase SurE [Flavobacteriales bacterium]|nr:5'/3'-nucleotidase SurE [Bacteroidota bacterium]MCB9241114.1 5'/3'-nucleotidase SurE [Flavobacteriales bacterium]